MSSSALDTAASANTDAATPPLERPLALHPRVALRPEPFGALAYHYDTRKLNFLRSHDLVSLVTSLADHPSPRLAFDAAGLDPARWPSFAKALAALASSGFLESPSPADPALEPA